MATSVNAPKYRENSRLVRPLPCVPAALTLDAPAKGLASATEARRNGIAYGARRPEQAERLAETVIDARI